MRMLAVVALCLSGLVVAVGHAEEKPKEKAKATLSGAFKRKAGELELKVELKKDNVLVYHVGIGENSCELICKYKLEKDVYSCEVTEFKKKGDFPIEKEKGYKFSMKIVGDAKKITISDFDAADVNDDAKKAVEGEYTTASD